MQLLSQVFSVKMLYRQLITTTLSIYKNFSLGNIFINQLHRLLPWDNLSRSAITDPHGLFSAFDGSPPKKNRL